MKATEVFFMESYRSLLCVFFFQFLASVATIAKDDEKVKNPNDSEDKGSEIKKDEGSEIKKDEGSEIKKDEGSEIKKDEGSEIKKDEGSEIKKDEGSEIKKDEGSEIKKDEGSEIKKDEGSEIKKDEGSEIKEEKVNQDNEVTSQIIGEEEKDEKKKEKINYVFLEEEIDGAGGSIYIGDGLLLSDGIQQSLSYGGTFFFSFANRIRFGFGGGYIETADSSDAKRFFIGGYLAYLFRFNKFWTSLGINMGYGSINKTPSFNVSPELSFALHLAKNFGISLSTSYLLFINEETFLSNKMFLHSSIPMLFLRLEFGAI
jgi:hypothetical protein